MGPPRKLLLFLTADVQQSVCPVCANMLTVSRTASDGVAEGQNRMECRTCPYQYLITDRLFERTVMKRKEVDDVMGGKDAWANADRTEGIYVLLSKELLSKRLNLLINLIGSIKKD